MAIPLLGMAAGALAGKALAIGENERQYDQQKRFTHLQVQSAKELADYNRQQQMQMWNETNYSAQVEQAKKAGLNPAMIYGMGGAGGATVGSPSGQMPTSGQAADANQAVSNQIGMGMQMAQLNLMEAQAEKAKAEAKQIAGAGTDVLNAQKDSLIQGIKSQQVQNKLTALLAEGQEIKNVVANQTINEMVTTIKADATKAVNEAEIAMNDETISTETKRTKINLIKQSYIQSLLQATLTKSAVKVNEAEVEKMAAEVQQGWRKVSQGWVGLSNEQQKIAIDKFAEEIKANYPSMWQVIGRWGENGLTDLTDILSLSEHGTTQQIKHHTVK